MTTKRSDFGSLAERTARPPSVCPDRSMPVGVHVWVRGDPENVPGLLAGWHQGADEWWGRVITVTDGQPLEILIRADLLRKA